jgi:hypothetical protein
LPATLERRGCPRRNARTNRRLFGFKLFTLADMTLSGQLPGYGRSAGLVRSGVR